MIGCLASLLSFMTTLRILQENSNLCVVYQRNTLKKTGFPRTDDSLKYLTGKGATVAGPPHNSGKPPIVSHEVVLRPINE